MQARYMGFHRQQSRPVPAFHQIPPARSYRGHEKSRVEKNKYLDTSLGPWAWRRGNRAWMPYMYWAADGLSCCTVPLVCATKAKPTFIVPFASRQSPVARSLFSFPQFGCCLHPPQFCPGARPAAPPCVFRCPTRRNHIHMYIHTYIRVYGVFYLFL